MQDIYFKYLQKLMVFSAIVIALEYAVTFMVSAVWVSPMWWVTALFFVALDVITYRLVYKQLQKNTQKLISMFMLSTTIRLLLSLAVIVVYVFQHRADAKAFILIFFVNYLLFTVFETLEVLKLTKNTNS